MLEGGVMSTSETVAGQSPADPPVVSTELAPELASPTEDLVTVVLGSWIILGAATDGWAHLNTLSGLQEDGFFTPWHALLYSGFTATAGWTVWLAYRRRHRARRWWVDGWPAGYRLGALGMVIFLVAGIADMAWHEVLGIETSIDALLSPSHLLLCVGSVLLLTSPARSWWASGRRNYGPAWWSRAWRSAPCSAGSRRVRTTRRQHRTARREPPSPARPDETCGGSQGSIGPSQDRPPVGMQEIDHGWAARLSRLGG
jgi:hypothetical protein